MYVIYQMHACVLLFWHNKYFCSTESIYHSIVAPNAFNWSTSTYSTTVHAQWLRSRLFLMYHIPSSLPYHPSTSHFPIPSLQGKYTFYNDSNQLPLNDPPRENALHGFLAGKKLVVYSTDISDYYGSVTLLYDFDGSDEGYPYTMRMLVSYTLSKAGFSVSFTITNTMPQAPLPLTVGWHPYFACSIYRARVQFDPTTAWNLVELNSNMDPTGLTHLDSTFDGSREIGGNATAPTYYDVEYKSVTPPRDMGLMSKVYDMATGQSVVLWQDSSFRLVHIFTGAMAFIGEDGIALEPMSGMADGFNNHDHLTILSAGETWTGAFGVYVE